MIIRGEREDIGTPELKSIDVKRNVSDNDDEDEHKTLLHSHHSTMIRRSSYKKTRVVVTMDIDEDDESSEQRDRGERGSDERDEKLKSVLLSPPHKRYKEI